MLQRFGVLFFASVSAYFIPCTFSDSWLCSISGLFSRNQAVFLVIWELQIILEFLPGGWIFLPSAMLTHLNVDAASKSELYI